MEQIRIRYGENVTLPLDTNDTNAVSATLYIGKPGELPVITSPATLTLGVGIFELSTSDTAIPLGAYKYQITVLDELGMVTKYPQPEDCLSNDDFPDFIVYEALDSTEVIS